MVEHIVLFQVKETASSDEVNKMMTGLSELKSKIPGIVELSVGTNFSDRSKGYTHGLVVRFEDRSALESYGPHQAHQNVVQNMILPITDNIMAVDYDI